MSDTPKTVIGTFTVGTAPWNRDAISRQVESRPVDGVVRDHEPRYGGWHLCRLCRLPMMGAGDTCSRCLVREDNARTHLGLLKEFTESMLRDTSTVVEIQRLTDELDQVKQARDEARQKVLALQTIATDKLLALVEERDQLLQWKKEMLSVMPPMQEIGRALGLHTGQEIYDKILPGIIYLKAALKKEQDEHERTKQRCDNWQETAAQHCRNEQFYRGLLVKIGELFGEAAKTADDGGVHEDVLVFKVVDLVEQRDALFKEMAGILLETKRHLSKTQGYLDVRIGCGESVHGWREDVVKFLDKIQALLEKSSV